MSDHRRISRRRVLGTGLALAAGAGGWTYPVGAPRAQLAAKTTERLRSIAAKRGIEVGVTGWSDWEASQLGDERFPELAQHFNLYLAINLKWAHVHPLGRFLRPTATSFDFTDLDAEIGRGFREGMRVRAGALVYHRFLPPWLTSGGLSKLELIQILRSHIKTVMGRYRGIVSEWIVVNEFFLKGYGDWWHETIGPEYVQIAFETAREADETARLVFNQTNVEHPGPWADHNLNVIADLRSKGLVDAMGFQFHVRADDPSDPSHVGLKAPSKPTLIAHLQQFKATGVELTVTEFDVNLSGMVGTREERWKRQADVAKDMFEGFVAAGGKSFGFFQYNDSTSWLAVPGNALPEGYWPDAEPTLFDANLDPKPAYYAIRAAIEALPEVPRPHSVTSPAIARD